MAAFRSLTANSEPLDHFKNEALKSCGPKSVDSKSQKGDIKLPLHLFEWSQDSQDGKEISNIESVSKLSSRDPATVRVV